MNPLLMLWLPAPYPLLFFECSRDARSCGSHLATVRQPTEVEKANLLKLGVHPWMDLDLS